MKKRKNKKSDRRADAVTVGEAQADARRARHRSRLLIEAWSYLGFYIAEDGVAPKLKLMIDSDEVAADRGVLEELRGELLVAATIENRRRRELLERAVSSAIDDQAEPIFDHAG